MTQLTYFAIGTLVGSLYATTVMAVLPKLLKKKLIKIKVVTHG